MTIRTPSPDEFLVAELLVERHDRFDGGWRTDGVLADRTPDRRGGVPVTHDEVAAALVHDSVAVRWVTPDGPYTAHSVAPSPRGLAVGPVVVSTPTTPTRTWTWDRATDRLDGLVPEDGGPGPGAGSAGAADRGDRVVELLLDPSALPRLYGDFAVVLGLLHAGHVLHQWASTAARRGWELSWRAVVPSVAVGLPGAVALLSVDVRCTPDAAGAASVPRYGRPVPDTRGGAWRDAVRAPSLRASLDPAALAERAARAPALLTGRGSFTATAARGRVDAESLRTSAQTGGPVSFVGPALPDDAATVLLDATSTALAALGRPGLDVLLLRPAEDGTWHGVLAREGRRGPSVGSPEELTTDQRGALRSASWVAVVLRVTTDGGADLFDDLVAAGALGQAVCLAAASLGQAAHPLRSLDERAAVATVGGGALPLYLVAGGVPSRTQTRWSTCP